MSEAKSTTVGTATAAPGQVVRGVIPVTELAGGTKVEIPLVIVNGAKPGPVFWVDGAIHGDEPEGPMACAIVETVVDIIESEGLLKNVQQRSAEIRETCMVGPVIGSQGAGLLLGLRTSRPAKDVQAELLKLDILTGTSADPNILRILAPFVLESEHVELLRKALARLPK